MINLMNDRESHLNIYTEQNLEEEIRGQFGSNITLGNGNDITSSSSQPSSSQPSSPALRY